MEDETDDQRIERIEHEECENDRFRELEIELTNLKEILVNIPTWKSGFPEKSGLYVCRKIREPLSISLYYFVEENVRKAIFLGSTYLDGTTLQLSNGWISRWMSKHLKFRMDLFPERKINLPWMGLPSKFYLDLTFVSTSTLHTLTSSKNVEFVEDGRKLTKWVDGKIPQENLTTGSPYRKSNRDFLRKQDPRPRSH